MDRKKDGKPLLRRDFLKASGVLGVAALSLSSASARPVPKDEPGRGKSGYRETEHGRRYYELARL